MLGGQPPIGARMSAKNFSSLSGCFLHSAKNQKSKWDPNLKIGVKKFRKVVVSDVFQQKPHSIPI